MTKEISYCAHSHLLHPFCDKESFSKKLLNVIGLVVAIAGCILTLGAPLTIYGLYKVITSCLEKGANAQQSQGILPGVDFTEVTKKAPSQSAVQSSGLTSKGNSYANMDVAGLQQALREKNVFVYGMAIQSENANKNILSVMLNENVPPGNYYSVIFSTPRSSSPEWIQKGLERLKTLVQVGEDAKKGFDDSAYKFEEEVIYQNNLPVYFVPYTTLGLGESDWSIISRLSRYGPMLFIDGGSPEPRMLRQYTTLKCS